MLKIQELRGAMLLDPHRGSAPGSRGPRLAAIEGLPPASAPFGSGPDPTSLQFKHVSIQTMKNHKSPRKKEHYTYFRSFRNLFFTTRWLYNNRKINIDWIQPSTAKYNNDNVTMTFFTIP